MEGECVATVSIVSHGQWELVEPLLQQLDRACHRPIARVVLTLNVPEVIRPDPTWRYELVLVRNSAPKGFGANHNAAFSHARTPWFIVLNPDIRLPGHDVIAELLEQAWPEAGLVAPRILEPGKLRPEPYRPLLTPLELVHRRLGAVTEPAAPVWVPGMFMALRRAAYEALGGFDTRYFMYCEDFDLCARLRLGGWSLQVTSLQVQHIAQRASHSSPRALAWHLASLAKLWMSGAFWQYRRLIRASVPPESHGAV